MSDPVSRRGFLSALSAGGASLAATARSYGRILGANDRISIGIIGCGNRGQQAHMEAVRTYSDPQNLQITAVCDPWSVRRQEAAAKAKEWYGTEPYQCVSYRDLVERSDVDAVMIASCEHQHTAHLEASARAGKDVYCEKPLGMDLRRVQNACRAVREADIVFQAGTQLRSLPSMTGCRALFRKGLLGKVSRIEQLRNGSRPYWYRYLTEARREDVDWDEFLMHRPDRPFRQDLFTGWYGYRDFSDGPLASFGSHYLDLVHYITGATFPVSAVAQGGIFTWRDDHRFTCPDHIQASWVYPEGFMATFSTNFGNASGRSFSIFGNQGVMDLLDWNAPTISSAGVGDGTPTTLGDASAVPHVSRPDHFLDWFQCLRTRKAPNASIQAGYQHAVAVILAMKAFDSGRRQIYNPVTQQIHEA